MSFPNDLFKTLTKINVDHSHYLVISLSLVVLLLLLYLYIYIFEYFVIYLSQFSPHLVPGNGTSSKASVAQPWRTTVSRWGAARRAVPRTTTPGDVRWKKVTKSTLWNCLSIIHAMMLHPPQNGLLLKKNVGLPHRSGWDIHFPSFSWQFWGKLGHFHAGKQDPRVLQVIFHGPGEDGGIAWESCKGSTNLSTDEAKRACWKMLRGRTSMNMSQ